MSPYKFRYYWDRGKGLLGEWRTANVHTHASARRAADAYFRNVPSERHVVFLVSGSNFVNGGWISLFSIAKESKSFSGIHGAGVTVCTALWQVPVRRYTKFDNDFELFPFRRFLKAIGPRDSVMVHIPEFRVREYASDIAPALVRTGASWRFNILLQNIDFAPSSEDVARLKAVGPVSATTAHRVYASDETAARLGCPVRFLSYWLSPEEFTRTPFEAKDELLVISPDHQPYKAEVLARIRSEFPLLRIVEIKNMTYRQYREVIQRAKYALTFGEGLDGYFVEPIFSGGIGLAFYNDRFFTPDFVGLPGVLDDTSDRADTVISFMKRTNRPQEFCAAADAQFAMLAKKYARAQYLGNLKAFYEEFFPA